MEPSEYSPASLLATDAAAATPTLLYQQPPFTLTAPLTARQFPEDTRARWPWLYVRLIIKALNLEHNKAGEKEPINVRPTLRF